MERGYEYFESGKIKDIHWDSNTVYGKVKGTEEYNVSAERIRQLEKNAMEKIKIAMSAS